MVVLAACLSSCPCRPAGLRVVAMVVVVFPSLVLFLPQSLAISASVWKNELNMLQMISSSFKQI